MCYSLIIISKQFLGTGIFFLNRTVTDLSSLELCLGLYGTAGGGVGLSACFLVGVDTFYNFI